MEKYKLISDKWQFCEDVANKLGLKNKYVYFNFKSVYSKHSETVDKMIDIQLINDIKAREITVKEFKEL